MYPFGIGDIGKEVDGSTEKIKHSKEKALSQSINEGSASSFSSSIGDSYITPFALALNANPLQIGLLSSFSGLASPLSQLLGSRLMKKHSRKKIVLRFVFLQSLLWIPIALLGILFYKNIIPSSLPYLLIIFFSLLIGIGGLAYPAWFSWMGDLVPAKDRGRYFSIRNTATGIVGLAGVLIGAIVLDTFKKTGIVIIGFSILFFSAFIFRLISFSIFRKQYAPKFKVQKGDYFSLFDFIKRFDNFGKFAVYQALFYFALMIGSPFFAVYMLKELQFSYITFMIVTMSSSVFYLIFTPLIGKFSDKFGNVKLFYIYNICFAISPILWIMFKSPIYLILFPQILVGIANAAFVISVTNFTYDSVSPQKRGICVAYSNLLSGVGIFLGSILGGFLVNTYHPSSINPFIFIFLITAGARLLVALLFIPKIKDARPVERLPPMRIHLVHPFRTLNAEIGWFKAIFK